MFVLIWVTLLISVRGCSAPAGSPKILKNSGCKFQSEVLTCVCVSEGFPLPTINLSLLETQTEYSVSTSVSNHTVKSSASVSVKDYSNTTVRCVSSNPSGKAEEVLTIMNELKQEDLLEKLLITVKQPQVVIAFLIGIVLSATICCLATKCHRKKQKSFGNMVETLEMMSTEVDPLTDARDVEPKEVEYSNIDFSRWSRKSPTAAEDMQETTETEYAEIKKDETEDGQDNDREEGDKLEGNDEEVAMIGEDKEAKHCSVANGEDVADVAVHSSVNDITAEI